MYRSPARSIWGRDRLTGTELNDLFLPRAVDPTCDPNDGTSCLYDLSEVATIDNLVNALNDNFDDLLLSLDATRLPTDLGKYAFKITITLEDGREFITPTGEVAIKN